MYDRLQLTWAPKRMAAKRMMLPTTNPVQPTAEHPFDPSHCVRQRPSGLRLRCKACALARLRMHSAHQPRRGCQNIF